MTNMKTVILKFHAFCAFLVLGFCGWAQTKPLYQLPEHIGEKKYISKTESPFLIGTDAGLFRVLSSGLAEPLWTEGKVDRIIRTNSKWYFSTVKGIYSSENLSDFISCNDGLPFLKVKSYDGLEKKLHDQVVLLKDLSSDPFDSNNLVTASKEAVYLSRDGGVSWKSIGSASKNTGGMKAVAVSQMPVYDNDGSYTGTELVVFMSHPIYGFSYYRADAKKPAWVDVSAGFAAMPSMTQVDEIADIIPVVTRAEDGRLYSEIYCSQTYLPNIYRFNWKTKRAEKVYQGEEAVDTIDGMCASSTGIIFSSVGQVSQFDFATGKVEKLESYDGWKRMLNSARSVANCAFVPKSVTGLSNNIELSELWMLNPDVILTPWGEMSNKKKAVYVSAYQMRNLEGIRKYRKIISENKLNALVVDMKDDYGLLRFEPNSSLLKQKGRVTQYKIDVNQFVEEFKKDGTYLIARIVVFKDRNLCNYDKKQYAVWDRSTNQPWMGIRGSEDVKDETGKVTGTKISYYDENWVDPYSEEVWEYNVEIARELIDRGFDEIQFDYIRFPTDGVNLYQAAYRWRDAGMDKESALVSFLSYARKNINAPIGIDIYGANGWYRSGTRTGQDVELMSEYVDVICPMFYPSHFEQNFLEFKPVEERPYRIYFYGSYRNTIMGRNRVVVRPWLQAFYMGVRYDKKYYDKNYVMRQVFGTRDGIDRGYMYWNNSGGYYEDISPDPGDNEMSPWHANEKDLQKRVPAFSGGGLSSTVVTDNLFHGSKGQDLISVWDSILEQEQTDINDYATGSSSMPKAMLYIKPFGVLSND